MHLHLFNVLVDDVPGDVTGVPDRANCAAGDPALDRARTWSILTLDPATAELRRNGRGETMCSSWAAKLEFLTDAARARAFDRRLADLAPRYFPGRLAHVTRALAGIISRR